MSILRRSVLVVLFTSVAIACQPQRAGLTESQRAAVADSARAIVQGMISNANKLDFAAALQVYSADPDSRYIENGLLYPSLDALKKSYAEFGPTLESLENTVDAWDVMVLAEDAAAFTLPIHFRIKAKGRPEYKGQYVWSGIVQRRGGTWKLVQSHESWLNAAEVMAAIAPPVAQEQLPKK